MYIALVIGVTTGFIIRNYCDSYWQTLALGLVIGFLISLLVYFISDFVSFIKTEKQKAIKEDSK